MDFVADELTGGRRFRALTVVDVYTRECLAIEVGQSQSLKGHHVVRVLQQIAGTRGMPQMLFCDNGSEFTSQVLDLWAYHNQRLENECRRNVEAIRSTVLPSE